MNTKNGEYNPQQALKLMLDKWVWGLERVGYPSPFTLAVPRTLWLMTQKAGPVALHKPHHSLTHPLPPARLDLPAVNYITALYESDGVATRLHVNSSDPPFVRSLQGEEPVTPPIGATAFIGLCLTAEIVRLQLGNQ